VAVVVTAVSGYDLSYVWRGAGKKPERSAGGYYMNAAQAGEAPGRWFGPGAEALGLADGGRVDRDPYDAVTGRLTRGRGRSSAVPAGSTPATRRTWTACWPRSLTSLRSGAWTWSARRTG
jgi:hypothetical protein